MEYCLMIAPHEFLSQTSVTPVSQKLFNTPLWFAEQLIHARDNSSKAGVFTNITQRSLDCTLRSAPPTASGDINGELDPLA